MKEKTHPISDLEAALIMKRYSKTMDGRITINGVFHLKFLNLF